ncbi:unnamed protein product [Linum tenue]|uniref:non-specific serine/threonine protein kinase n=1 Tax=Linum tenue TaxID=586396 RepID=A0AAV0RD74_9ROSI|nr:unnamed protein product [Linum tenue]
MALLEFKSMISSDPLGALSSWNDSTHFCEWHGVSCSRRQVGGRVAALRLSSQMLYGSISPHIGNLSFLKELDLTNNSFIEGIPLEIGHLHRLQYLQLTNNSLRGEIPSNISGCSALAEFSAANNKLVGQLPWQIGGLNKLRVLFVTKNDLTGSIPPSFGNLSSLQILRAGENHFSGSTVLDPLSRLKRLQFLDLVLNNLTGEIPASFFNLSSLTDVYFSYNQLHGNLPRNLGISLPNLRTLDVAYNRFTGTVPPSLSNASSLVVLQLPSNNFTGTMPSMESSRNLMWLSIFNNSLGSGQANDLSFLCSLTNASSLQWLLIHYNNFGGSLPKQVANLSTGLEVLSLKGNRLSGGIPGEIQNLVSLQWLDATYNNFSGTIPPAIGKLQALQQLQLSYNSISGSIPSSIGNLTKLLGLYLSNNHLQGGIPAGIENCRNLMTLDISYNNLSGVIPSQIMSISSLSRLLNLSYNHFAGAIPVEVGSLTNLEDLDLSHNALSEEIPDSLGSCVAMEELHLQGNLLQGTIPSSIQSLKGIRILDVSSNNLSGQIPKFLEDIKELQLLNMSYNDFEDEVPLGGVFKNASIILLDGNRKLCGGLAELQLPSCSFRQHKKVLSHKLKIVISTISSLGFLTCIASCLLIFWIKKKGKPDTIPADDFQLQVSYHSLHKATDGFATTNLIGVGSFGSVYKGVLDMNEHSTTIAVKVFNLQRRGASKSFMAECAALKNIRHRNLVKVLTACSGVDHQGNDFKALVYEFLVNGSLEDWLHPVQSGDEPPRSLNFIQRLNISIDVAYAMNYLHHQCGTPIVHCDLKPSNVLLDEDLVGHVGDFGLARFLPSVADSSSTCEASSSIGIKGTVGYAPPEYGMGHEVSVQGDVYSYGVHLLEMFTGRKPTDEAFQEGFTIHRFVRTAISEKLVTELLDPVLLTTHNNTIRSNSSTSSKVATKTSSPKAEEILISILEIGVACSSDIPQERISMNEVVTRLVSSRKSFLDQSTRRRREVR